MANAVRRAGVAGGVMRAAQQSSLTRIFKGVSIQPLTLHFFFKDLGRLPSAFPGVAQYRLYLGMLERLGSFHFLGPRFYQSVSSPAFRGRRRTPPGTPDPLPEEHNGPRRGHEQQGAPETGDEGGQVHRLRHPEQGDATGPGAGELQRAQPLRGRRPGRPHQADRRQGLQPDHPAAHPASRHVHSSAARSSSSANTSSRPSSSTSPPSTKPSSRTPLTGPPAK